MGNFSYICKHCGKSIRIDEKCVLIHVRHGKEIGRTEGTYAGYGNVKEDNVFRNNDENNPNSHAEICNSELSLDDSLYLVESSQKDYLEMLNNKLSLKEYIEFGINEDAKFKLYKNKPISLFHFVEIKENVKITSREGLWDKLRKYQKEYFFLPTNPAMNLTPSSGTVAYHKKCYQEEINRHHKNDNEILYPSRSDVNQGWGTPRKAFM